MPIYIYKCDDEACDYELEEMRAVADRDRSEACPVCERGFIRLALSTPALTPGKWGNQGKL